MNSYISGKNSLTDKLTRNNVDNYYKTFETYRKAEMEQIKKEKEIIKNEKELIKKDRSRKDSDMAGLDNIKNCHRTIIDKKAEMILDELRTIKNSKNYNLDNIIGRIKKWGDTFNYVGENINDIKEYNENAINSLIQWINKGKEQFYKDNLRQRLMGNIQMNCTQNGNNWECKQDTQSGGKHKSRKYKPRKSKPRKSRKYKPRKSRKMYGGAGTTARCKCTIQGVAPAVTVAASGSAVAAASGSAAEPAGQPAVTLGGPGPTTIKNKMRNRLKRLSKKKPNITAEIENLQKMNIDQTYISNPPFDDEKNKQLIKYMYDNVTTDDSDRQKIFVEAYEKIKNEKLLFTYDDKGITQKYKAIKKSQRGPGLLNRFTRKSVKPVISQVKPIKLTEQQQKRNPLHNVNLSTPYNSNNPQLFSIP